MLLMSVDKFLRNIQFNASGKKSTLLSIKNHNLLLCSVAFFARSRVIQNGYNLIFTSVQPRHLGSYVCEASNGVNLKQRKTVRLTITGKLFFFPLSRSINSETDNLLLLLVVATQRRVQV